MTLDPQKSSPMIGVDDRRTAANLLHEAYENGSLSFLEKEERLQVVLSARTHDELLQALTAIPASDLDGTSTVAAVQGPIVRRGQWRVPRVLKIESPFGRVRLNLATAVIEHPTVDIVLQLGTGRAVLIVPRNATVDLDGLGTGLHAARYRPGRRAGTGGPTIRVSGALGLGRLSVRHSWRR